MTTIAPPRTTTIPLGERLAAIGLWLDGLDIWNDVQDDSSDELGINVQNPDLGCSIQVWGRDHELNLVFQVDVTGAELAAYTDVANLQMMLIGHMNARRAAVYGLVETWLDPDGQLMPRMRFGSTNALKWHWMRQSEKCFAGSPEAVLEFLPRPS